ncbi:GL24358 [Drosophila persimilis]|uniref:Golgi SNAP receptor complex member 1 n=2 Tax=pseudoobscura subgroup TaxID=32358 RepID=A0A6I8UP71_DROPS|nr:Golgi SNAP receptor complex member 1 [Drosophila pseudoobscura]XP_002013851.1 Golgi SNAP receptor complex member 1 [Drosophila persimilis]EDW24837.1 GL24358 [Drosophila persimilis]
MASSSYDVLRKQARSLENEIDLKLVAFSKIGAGSGGSSGISNSSSADTSPLLGDLVFDSLSEEIEQMLEKLSTLNESMSDLPATGAAAMHTLQRHREILHGYRQEFNKICANHTVRIEREELLRGSGLTTSGSPSISGLSRREMYMKETGHLSSASHLVNDQINIAIETRDHLHAQRQAFKRLQTRFNDISNRFPLISSLIQRINIKKRRDSLILGAVVAFCIILLLLYAFN